VYPQILTHYSIGSSVIYSRGSQLDDVIIDNLSGVIQGDPLSGWIYDICWSHCLHDIRSKWQDFIIFTIHDDTYLFGNNVRSARLIFEEIQHAAFSDFNLQLQSNKSELFSATFLSQHISSNPDYNAIRTSHCDLADELSCVFITNGGLLVAGTPVGTYQFEEDFVKDKINDRWGFYFYWLNKIANHGENISYNIKILKHENCL
jgi:hypothetical protein